MGLQEVCGYTCRNAHAQTHKHTMAWEEGEDKTTGERPVIFEHTPHPPPGSLRTLTSESESEKERGRRGAQ